MNLAPTIIKRPKRTVKQILASGTRAKMSSENDGCSGCIDEFRVRDEYCTACLLNNRRLFRGRNPNERGERS